MPPSESTSRDHRVNEAIAAYLEAVERGEKPVRTKFLAANPEIAAELESFLGNAAQFHQFAEPAPESLIPLPLGGNSPVEVGTQTPGIQSDPNQPTMMFQQRGVSSARNVLRYFGDYELIEEIARGGMGVVYKARQVTLNRIVAVKMILGGQLAGPEDVQRFHNEAEAAAKLDHPDIVPIYEVGQRDGQHFFSMGFVEGQSLAKRVTEGPLESREAAKMVKVVSEAVQYAHDKGVIHRDLKPGNILLDKKGRPRITDFGLAKLTENGSDLTGTGQILGTPSYMPPEQAAAQVSAVGRLSDVYSLGAILYCLLTGRPPFQAANPLETLLQVQKQEPVAPRQLNPTIPLDLNTIVLKCLDKSPSRRYVSAKALVEELNRYLEGRPIEARPVSRRERAWRWCRRNPAVAGLTAAVAVCLIVGTTAALSIRASADVQRQQDIAVSLVQRLSSTDVAFVPGIIEQIDEYRHYADPLLRNEFANSPAGSRQKLHSSLALLPVDPTQVNYLYERLLKAEPPEVFVIREALSGHKDDLTERLWTLLENPNNDQDQWFRAACALSGFAPDDPRWVKASGEVAAMLIIQKPFVIAQWTDALKGVCRSLIPPLADFLVDEKRGVPERGLIATVYGRFALDMPDAYARLEQRFTETAEPNATVEQKVALAKNQASIALALMLMSQSDKVWPLLKHSPDPTLRSFLIDRMASAGVDPKNLIARLKEEQDVSAKRALLLSLGQFGPDRLPVVLQLRLVPRLLELYQDDPDPGIHGTAEWLLRQLGEAEKLNLLDTELRTNKVWGGRRWFVNRQGQTMVVIPKPGEFWMGEGPERHRSRIDRSFAIGSKEVTVEQFRHFLKEHQYHPCSPTVDSPVNQVLWYEAAAYCNWLSDQEGIPKDQWCYEPNKDEKYEAGMKMSPIFLQRTGYRLPTEAEWEFACRGGTDTRYSFGDSGELLGQYCWHVGNSLRESHPVGSLKPSDLGLFDMHGNIWEWCQDVHGAYGDGNTKKQQEENAAVHWQDSRALRGGSFDLHSSLVRSAYRLHYWVTSRYKDIGFRLARTLPHVPLTDSPLPPKSGEIKQTAK